jgi:hypothetical protein
VKAVLTPAGRFPSAASAARYYNVYRATVLRRIREGRPGWQFEEPYQIPIVTLAGRPRRSRGRETSETKERP